jgi:hypothetical protein
MVSGIWPAPVLAQLARRPWKLRSDECTGRPHRWLVHRLGFPKTDVVEGRSPRAFGRLGCVSDHSREHYPPDETDPPLGQVIQLALCGRRIPGAKQGAERMFHTGGANQFCSPCNSLPWPVQFRSVVHSHLRECVRTDVRMCPADHSIFYT